MDLRDWQASCIAKAISQYKAGYRHFLCLATPGAGKTVMAAVLAKRLLNQDEVDLVLCFSPSVIISSDFQAELEQHTQLRMDGFLGSKGRSLTYQSMLHLDDAFWALFNSYRIFVIFDEIHHCAGDQLDNANAWGQKIIRHIQGRATYTLALSGTPWRSDKIPIALSSYRHNNRIHCDFIYGLTQAVAEKTCQKPRITLIDNDHIFFRRGEEIETYSSFAELLKGSRCSYQLLTYNDDLIVYLLKQASKKLAQIRKSQPSAGGLIVAASVEHAHKIASLLARHLGENASIATYLEEDAQSVISYFKSTTHPWIISVGMISEGTNIPRLRVCCYLTRVKTELHFRQVLGRILRVLDEVQSESFLYMPAEPRLVEYAYRIAEELPESATIIRESMTGLLQNEGGPIEVREPKTPSEPGHIKFEPPGFNDNSPLHDFSAAGVPTLAGSYAATINMFGRFRQELLQLNRLYP